ncbi:MAG: hypothetical protein ACREL7_02165 [Longimicrobiales bacterium]
MQCFAHAAQLGRMAGFFAANDARVFIIGSGLRAVGTAAARLLASPHTILFDPDRSTYRAYGLQRRVGIIQMSGTVIVDRAGLIDYVHVTANSFDALRKAEVTERIGTAKSDDH